MNRIKVLSNILSLIFVALALLTPFVLFASGWLLYTGSYSLFGASFSACGELIFHSFQQFVVFSLINLISSSILIFCFGTLACLFKLYAKGLYFTKHNIILYKRVGWTLIIHFFAGILVSILNSRLLAGPDNLNLSYVSFSDILTGLVILCISWVFNEAHKIEEENQLTV